MEEGHLRIHFPGNNDKFNELGMWIWKGVEMPSEQTGAWLTGATTNSNPATIISPIEITSNIVKLLSL